VGGKYLFIILTLTSIRVMPFSMRLTFGDLFQIQSIKELHFFCFGLEGLGGDCLITGRLSYGDIVVREGMSEEGQVRGTSSVPLSIWHWRQHLIKIWPIALDYPL